MTFFRSRRAVVLGQVLAQVTQIEAAINAAQQVVLRNVAVEIEGIEEPPLAARLLSHHLFALPENIDVTRHRAAKRSSVPKGVFQQNWLVRAPRHLDSRLAGIDLSTT
ncbi:MAG: hypothetical protein V4650_01290 [Pseudomonadota bacterium]